MTKEEKRELKVWLTGLLPEGWSRNDVADELGVTRKTISSMLSPESSSFATGLTMLRYLRLAGAVVDAPADSPASSRLATLEDQVGESVVLMRRALEALESLGAQPAGEGGGSPRRERSSGTDG